MINQTSITEPIPLTRPGVEIDDPGHVLWDLYTAQTTATNEAAAACLLQIDPQRTLAREAAAWLTLATDRASHDRPTPTFRLQMDWKGFIDAIENDVARSWSEQDQRLFELMHGFVTDRPVRISSVVGPEKSEYTFFIWNILSALYFYSDADEIRREAFEYI